MSNAILAGAVGDCAEAGFEIEGSTVAVVETIKARSSGQRCDGPLLS
jgi:hypothetical protein